MDRLKNEPLNRQQEIIRNVGFLTFAGIALFAVVLLSPDAGSAEGLFFRPALQTSWQHLWDIPAVWSSFKIILFSIGLFLLIESAGTILAVFKCKSVAVLVFFLQVLPCLGLLCGGYYFLKSLL